MLPPEAVHPHRPRPEGARRARPETFHNRLLTPPTEAPMNHPVTASGPEPRSRSSSTPSVPATVHHTRIPAISLLPLFSSLCALFFLCGEVPLAAQNVELQPLAAQ